MLFFVLLAGPAAPQSRSLIHDEADRVREGCHRLGPFWVTPLLQMSGGYDTNANFASLGPVRDLVWTGTAAASVALIFQRRSVLRFNQRFDARYYRELVDLRDVFGATQAEMALGGKDVLARVGAELRSERVNPPNELDLLFDQRVRQIAGGLDLRLGRRHKLSLELGSRQIDVQDVGARVEVGELLDRSERTAELQLLSDLTARTETVLRLDRRLIDYTGELQRGDAVSTEGVVGLVVSPVPTLRMQAQLGYKEIQPGQGTGAGFRGWVGSATLDTRASRRIRIGGEFSRTALPSVLGPNRFFVAWLAGGFAEYQPGRRFSIRPAVRFRRIDFPEPLDLPGRERPGPEAVRQDIREYSLDCWYRPTAPWSMGVAFSYADHRSNVFYLERDRFLVRIILASEL